MKDGFTSLIEDTKKSNDVISTSLKILVAGCFISVLLPTLQTITLNNNMFLITLGILGLYWYKVHEDYKRGDEQ